MQFLADNKRDFLLYLTKSYAAKASPTGVQDVWCIKGDGPGETVYLINAENGTTGMETWTNLLDNYSLHPQTLGMTNIEDTLFYISRVPIRHVRKGFGEHGNYLLFTPHATMLNELGKYPKFSKIAYGAYNNNYATVPEAIEGISRGKFLGRAVSRYFGVYVHPEYENIILLYKNVNIGTVSENGEIILAAPHAAYKEALQSYLGCKVSVNGKELR
jgi:hypothetical protein